MKLTDLVEDRSDWPLMVSMLGKLVSASFKSGGLPVYLQDAAVGAHHTRIVGTAWRQPKTLLVTVAGRDMNRGLVYSSIDSFKLTKGEDEWRLVWTD